MTNAAGYKKRLRGGQRSKFSAQHRRDIGLQHGDFQCWKLRFDLFDDAEGLPLIGNQDVNAGVWDVEECHAYHPKIVSDVGNFGPVPALTTNINAED